MKKRKKVIMGAESEGRFKLITRGPERGTIDHGWCGNMILDSGINQLLNSTNSCITHVHVGAGSTPVSRGQSRLVSRINGRTISAKKHGYNSEGDYGWTIFESEFAQGAAAGNVAELGVGWSAAGDLFSRALVLDIHGDPTVITVLPTEFLTVVYELRTWWVTPEPYVLEYTGINGPTSTTVITEGPVRTEGSTGAAAGYTARTIGLSPSTGSMSKLINGVNTATASITQNNPQIKGARCSPHATGQVPPYRDGTFITFDPPIEKTNEYEVTVTFQLKYARKGELDL